MFPQYIILMGAEKAREEVIEAFERTAGVYGWSRSNGRLYGILFFSDEPMSLDELAEESGYARSTVSNAMNKMENLHAVKRRSGDGRTVLFEAENDLEQVMQEFVRNKVRKEIDIMLRALENAEEELEGAGEEDDLEKIRELEDIYRKSDKLVDAFLRMKSSKLAGALDDIVNVFRNR